MEPEASDNPARGKKETKAERQRTQNIPGLIREEAKITATKQQPELGVGEVVQWVAHLEPSGVQSLPVVL